MKPVRDTRRAWAGLSWYERFEQLVALVLTGLIAVLIVVATWNLLLVVARLVAMGVLDPARPEVFQAVFGMIMIVLISLEFNHSLIGVLERHETIVHLRTVVMIALLAVLRKFIVMPVEEVAAPKLLGLSAAALSLGAVLWSLRENGPALPGPPRHGAD